ncbi:hypothetical protein GLYMA_15G158000v4 [Glycine max]|uniref:Uncharacterized protein n=1 Tax=Glycine max TaxID=3847 RepID=A0A0R0G1H5_SOYBN|nr:hypothetical protein GYH30_042503 [Glycine max]KRH12188.1 hypothetical protein GLYMA_15G158000v4 [Glycine max]
MNKVFDCQGASLYPASLNQIMEFSPGAGNTILARHICNFCFSVCGLQNRLLLIWLALYHVCITLDEGDNGLQRASPFNFGLFLMI